MAFVVTFLSCNPTTSLHFQAQSRRSRIHLFKRSIASKWRMVTSPDPSSPPTTAASSQPTESTTDSSSSSSSPYASPSVPAPSIDPDELLDKAKAVISDVSDRPLYYSKIGAFALGAVILYTILRAIVSAIDSLPVLPSTLELIGLGYSAWFVWRYVLFRESRVELLEEIDEFLGRTRPGGNKGQ